MILRSIHKIRGDVIMTVFDRVDCRSYQPILFECLRNGGIGFDMTSKTKYNYIDQDFNWWERFINRKTFFGYKWELSEKSDYFLNVLYRYEKELNNLPNGITYEKNTTIIEDGRERFRKGDRYAQVRYNTQFIIHVSEEFSKHINEQYDGSRVFMWNCPELESALLFKEKVISMHSDILKPLYKDLTNKCLSLSGVIDVDGFEYSGSSFKAYGMKNLKDKTQLLGLLIAIAEASTQWMPHEDIVLVNIYDEPIKGSLGYMKFKEPDIPLNEW